MTVWTQTTHHVEQGELCAVLCFTTKHAEHNPQKFPGTFEQQCLKPPPLRIPSRTCTQSWWSRGLLLNAGKRCTLKFQKVVHINREIVELLPVHCGCVRSTTDASSRTDHLTGVYPSAYFLTGSSRPLFLRLRWCLCCLQRAGGAIPALVMLQLLPRVAGSRGQSWAVDRRH